MNPSPSPDESSRPPPANDLETIRELLFGQETRQLHRLRERIENPGVHARDVSQVLPEAVALSSARDGRLAAALTPAVESALKESVRRDPSALVNALFPIIGPAIRKSIAETFSKLVQSLNETLEHSFSLRGLTWRLEAARTGRSFAEVVLAHTLVFRVEQLLLIHKETGLLLLHLVAPGVKSRDAGMVSGLLTAVQDFARDSFHLPAGDALETLQMGELNVWVESSPLVTLAAVIRGQAPYDFRAVLQGALEDLHHEHGAALAAFDGESAPFEPARPRLESCLQTQFSEPAKKKSRARLFVLAGVVFALLAVWLFFGLREKRRWAGYLGRLQAEPGIVVTEAGTRSGKFHVAGLRDPLAADPADLLQEFKLKPENVAGRWEPFQALHPALVLQRAVTLLHPPPGARLRVQDGVLTVDGLAPAAWVESARQRAVTLPGIHGLEIRGWADQTRAILDARQREIRQAMLFFGDGTQLVVGQEAALETLVAQLNDFHEAASRGGWRARVTVTGHTDNTGTDDVNLRLRRQRAEAAVGLLTARGVPAGLLAVAGVDGGESLPAASEDPSRNRRVTFDATVADLPPGTSAP